MCGDATSREDVMSLLGEDKVNLVLTDPPYGIRLQGNMKYTRGQVGSGKRCYSQLIGDNNTDFIREHYKIVRLLCNNIIIWGGQNFTDFLPPRPGYIFWDKDKRSNGLSFGDGELAWCSQGTKIRKYIHRWNSLKM